MGSEKIVLLAAWGMAGRGQEWIQKDLSGFYWKVLAREDSGLAYRGDGEEWTKVKVFQGEKHWI